MSSKPQYRIKHIGINNSNEAQADAMVDQLCHLFNVERSNVGSGVVFAGTIFEVMKHDRIGIHGHIALQTDDVEAAMEDLAQKGITFQKDTIHRNEEGKITFIYLEQQVGGFSFHLTI